MLGCYQQSCNVLVCKTFFKIQFLTIFADIDECNGPVTIACGDHTKCENVVGGYNCSCKEGYQPSTGKLQFKPNDGTSCQEIPMINCELNYACIAETINKTLAKIRKIKEPLAVLQEINQKTAGQISPVDVISYIEALSVSCPLLSTINNTISDNERLHNLDLTLNEYVNTVNNFVQKDKITVWEAIPADNRRRSLTKLIHAAEQTTALMSQNFQATTEVEFNASDLALKVFTFEMKHMDLIHQSVHMGGDTIRVSAKKKEASTSKGTVAVVFLQYSNIGCLLSSSQNFSLKENSEHGETVGSSVIAVTISSTPPWLYPAEEITFTLKHAQTVDKKDIKCAFWNYSEDTMEGSWLTEGCERTHFNSTHTSCRCNHLTHFAVLMSSNNSKVLFCSITAGLLHYFLLAAFAWMCIEGIHLYLIVVGVIYNKGFLHKNFYIFGYVSPAVVVGISAALGYKYYGTSDV
ncbi:hypothetical protein JD844_017722 [Phrynosoma platyrhinos]|uniref:EGF, latrophilin seven transmembrane domain-containing protein 1 n=1 Tax=Phrynosoma platyrhinos TaxID=52577 RepID=A0ABQ7SMB1_PHRPL|nr:hypothetical protein JD844_017722 [Phrynosoma platyrhinos]